VSNSTLFPSLRCIVPGPGERGQIAIRLLFLIGAYSGTGRLGLAIPYIGSNITLVWLPTGIAVAALARWGWRYWPGIWLGAVLVNLSIGSSWTVAAGIATGNTLSPLATWWILRLLGFHRTFDRQQDVALFGLAAGAGMLLSASGGVVNLWLAGQIPGEMIGSAWQTWWMGDTVGVLLAGPLLLTVSENSRQMLLYRRSELMIWCLLTVLVAWATFIVNTGQDGRALPLVFLTLPLVVWAALRFGVTGASLAALILSAIATWGTASGRGPFFQSDVHQGLLLLWAFMVSSVLMGLLITALQAERDRAVAVLQQERDRAQQYFGIAGTALVVLHADRTVGLINQAGCRLMGWPEAGITGRDWFDHFVPSRYRAEAARAFAAMMSGEGAADEYSEGLVLTRHGEERIVSWHHTVLRDAAGNITGTLSSGMDITRRKQAEAEIHRLAFYDPLTGLANRRLLYDRLHQAFAKSTRQQSHGAILFIDLDHFKTLNDTRGHDVGDQLLIEVAKRLVDAVREEDTVARLGGDEFVVMLERLGGELLPAAFQAERVAEKIRAALNRPYALNSHEYLSSPSIGISLFLAGKKTVDELLKHADIALYRAKGAGRNAIRCFDVTESSERESGAEQPVA
jgi:diguanylate cyclase (GGDEF)-like protein/PAS domain S-box-containing protein